jgi:hypothetical protein
VSSPSTHPNSSERFCIIGAGPSGLAQARAFAALGVDFDMFERHHSPGGLWDLENPGTPMYESAHFISSRTMSGFVGYPMPDDYPDYPSRAQVLDYLRGFARRYGLSSRVQFGRSVESVVPDAGAFVVTVDGQSQRYAGVVCASGVNWTPRLPTYPGHFSGLLRHACAYVRPSEFDGKRVLIVGLGNSGADIACDAARHAQRAWVSVRRGYHFIPKHIFGKPADVFSAEGPHLPLWLERPLFSFLLRLLVGDVRRLGMPTPDHRVLETHPLLNDQLLHHLRHGDIQLKPAITHFEGQRVHFADGSHETLDQVLFATGYEKTLPYLDEQFVDRRGSAVDHFLTCFSRRYPGLVTLGFAELNGALFPHLDRWALLTAHYARALRQEPAAARAFEALLQNTQFDLSAGRRMVDSPRHSNYCDGVALFKATRSVFKTMRWPMPSPELFDSLPNQ